MCVCVRNSNALPCVSVQVGTLRFCGSTEFAGGHWAGVELDDAEGKNNGSVAGVQYFTCPPRHGSSHSHCAPVRIDSPASESF